MSDNGRCLTFDIDGILLAQIQARAGVTGRSRSSEVSFLADLGLKEVAQGSPEMAGDTLEPRRVCIYFTGQTMSRIGQYAVSNHIPKGRAVNILLRTALEASAQRELRFFAKPSDPAAH
jgi:hypothetical protein